MRLTTLTVGALSTNCYIVAPDSGNECAVIDAGGEPDRIAKELTRLKLAPHYILSTHGHADHTGAVAGLISQLGGTFAIGRADAMLAASPPAWLTEYLQDYAVPPSPGRLLDGRETLEIGSLVIQVVHTPGHTPGSVCFKLAGAVFTGDTLFKMSIGRYDLEGGDGDLELKSIRDHLLTLPDSTVVYPGHGPSTTIAHEKANNPFLQ